MRRSKFRVLLASGALCVGLGVVAATASAHPHHPMPKHHKGGGHLLQVEVRGTITNIVQPTATEKGSVTIAAAGAVNAAPNGFEWTCVLNKRTKITRFEKGDRVKARCHNVGTSALKLKMLRKRDRGDKVRVHATGGVEAYTAPQGTTPGAITVNTGVAGQPPVTCAVTAATHVVGSPAPGDRAKVFCRSKNGVLTASHVVERPVVAWAKGPLAIDEVNKTVTVAGVTCAVPAGTTLPTAGKYVRIICKGSPLQLVRIWTIPMGHHKK